MKKMLRLLNVQLWIIMADMLSIGKSKNKKPKLLYVGILLFMLLMSGISFIYSFGIGMVLKSFNSLEILPGMYMAITCIIVFMTTVFKVKGVIFGFRDYDMVMSLPVSTGAIVACRLIILYALNLLAVIIMMGPMLIVYAILAKPEAMYYIISIISLFFVPLFPIVIASVFGTIIAYVASRFRRSNLISMIFTLGFVVLILILSFSFSESGEKIVNIGNTLLDQTKQLYPLSVMYMEAIVHSDLASLILFVGVSLGGFILYTLVVRLIFKRINTSLMTGSYSRNYRLGELKTASPFKALYLKEIKRYLSSTLYVTNTAIGVIMLTIGAVAIIFVDIDKIIPPTGGINIIASVVPLGILFCIMLTCTTMASISLEGKNLWIIKSMPLSPKMVYLSKVAVNLTILSPAMIDVIIIGIVLKLGFLDTLLLVAISIASAVFISIYGLLINLLFPNFDWTTEVIVVKQSAATLITIFSGMIYVGIQSLIIALIPNTTLAYLICFLLLVVSVIVLYCILSSYGRKRYYELQQ